MPPHWFVQFLACPGDLNAPILSVAHLSKTYASGLKALEDINLEIAQGEIFALLGPNGAGKTTLISIICGSVNKSGGVVLVGGEDNVLRYRSTRARIGLVPQEIALDIFRPSGPMSAFCAACSASGPTTPFSKACSRICRCGRSATRAWSSCRAG